MSSLLIFGSPMVMGTILLSWPGVVTALLHKRLEPRPNAFWGAALAGLATAVGLHLAFVWCAGLDPVSPEDIAAGTAEVFRLGGYPALGWYPLAMAIGGLALSLTAIRRRAIG